MLKKNISLLLICTFSFGFYCLKASSEDYSLRLASNYKHLKDLADKCLLPNVVDELVADEGNAIKIIQKLTPETKLKIEDFRRSRKPKKDHYLEAKRLMENNCRDHFPAFTENDFVSAILIFEPESGEIKKVSQDFLFKILALRTDLPPDQKETINEQFKRNKIVKTLGFSRSLQHFLKRDAVSEPFRKTINAPEEVDLNLFHHDFKYSFKISTYDRLQKIASIVQEASNDYESNANVAVQDAAIKEAQEELRQIKQDDRIFGATPNSLYFIVIKRLLPEVNNETAVVSNASEEGASAGYSDREKWFTYMLIAKICELEGTNLIEQKYEELDAQVKRRRARSWHRSRSSSLISASSSSSVELGVPPQQIEDESEISQAPLSSGDAPPADCQRTQMPNKAPAAQVANSTPPKPQVDKTYLFLAAASAALSFILAGATLHQVHKYKLAKKALTKLLQSARNKSHWKTQYKEQILRQALQKKQRLIAIEGVGGMLTLIAAAAAGYCGIKPIL